MGFFRNLSDVERRVLFWGTVGALSLTIIPYLAGFLVAGRDYVYLWMNPLGSADTNVYFSFIRQIADGSVFVQNLHTGEPQTGTIFHPLWLVLGWTAGLFRLAPAVVFHGTRLVLGAALLVAFYGFLTTVFSDIRRRMIAFLLAAFSSGIGVFFSLDVSQVDSTEVLFLLPADQWISESNTFLTLLHSPLFILSQLLLLAVLWLFLHPARSRQLWLVVTTLFLLGVVHPYDLVTVAAVVPIFLFIRSRTDPAFSMREFWAGIRSLTVGGVAAAVPALALLVGGRLEPAIGGWMRQNVTVSPPLHSYLLGYGFVLLFAVPGLVALRRRLTPSRWLVVAWLLVGISLLYAPFQMNRRMTNGLHLALVIVAAVGIDACWRLIAARLPKPGLRRDIVVALCAWVFGFLLFFGTPATVVKAIYWSRIPERSIYHITRPVAAGMDWLKNNVRRDAVVLSHSYNGNIIPARAGVRVYIGHGHQTVTYAAKRRSSNEFFRTNRDDDAKKQFLRDSGISHLFFSPLEDAMGEFEPATKDYLRPVYANGAVTIYRVEF